MTLLPKVKLKAAVNFPATVLDGTGIDVVKSNGSYQFNLDYEDFAPPVSNVNDAAYQNVLLWNSLTDTYSLTPATLLRGSINVKDYGAIGDNSTDDTAAIAASIAVAIAAENRAVYFPAGSYVISNFIDITSPVVLIGEGRSVTTIRQTGGSTAGVKFTGPFKGGGIRHITIEAGTGFLNSGFAGTGSTSVALTITDVYFFVAEDFAIYNFDYGIAITATPNNGGSWHHVYQNLDVRFFAGDGVQIDQTGTFATNNIGGDRFFKNFVITNNSFTGSNGSSCGIRIGASGGDMFDTGDTASTSVGISVATATGAGITAPRFSNIYSDTCTFAAWVFDGTNGPVYGVALSSCWGSYTTSGPGLLTLGTSLTDLSWNGGGLYENGTNGWHHMGGANIYVRNATIARNSKTSSNTSDGVLVDANVGSWGVQNCIVGNFGPTVAWSQANGINIAAGTGANISITGNNLGSSGAGKSGLVNGATGLNQIAHNLPRQSGYSPDQAQNLPLLTGGTAITAGGTFYCGPLAAATVLGQNVFVMGAPGIVSAFTMMCTAAPGAAQTFTYTVMKNDIATSMAGTISGAGSFAVTVTANPVTVTATDSIAMRIVTSAGATTTSHRGNLLVQP